MTATTEPRGGLDLGWDPGEDGWGDAMNANLLRLSRLGFHPSVLSATTATPPGSPTSGSGYIIPSGATGAWAGKTGQVAVWDGSAWAYAVPRDGWTMHVDGAGLTTYDGGAWSQSNLATATGVGAEPYAGVPAQTSFWRSTAAGVRAWVQLVAADITDLATTLAAYLTKANPTYTGRLTGPTQYLEADEQTLLAIRRPAVGPQGGRIHGVAFQAQTLNGTWREFGRTMTYISNNTDAAWTGGMRLMAYKDGAILQALEAGPDGVRVGADLPLQMGTTTIVDASRNGTFKSLTSEENVFLPGSIIWKSGATNYFLAYGTSTDWTLRSLTDAGAVVDKPISILRAAGGEIQIGYSGGLRPVRIGGTLKNDALAGTGARALVALADGTIDDQDAATFRGTIGALAAADPVFTGALKQGATTRLSSSGGADLSSLRVSNLSNAFNGVLVSDYVGIVGVHGATDFRDNYIQAAPAAHNHFSKQDVSASTTIGSIDATAVKVTATDVILTLSGGVDGQGWDVINPTTSTGIAIPSGATLWKSIGFDVGPTTIALGGGKPIRITRIDANTWIMLGSQ